MNLGEPRKDLGNLTGSLTLGAGKGSGAKGRGCSSVGRVLIGHVRSPEFIQPLATHEPSVLAHACILRTREVESGRSEVIFLQCRMFKTGWETSDLV